MYVRIKQPKQQPSGCAGGWRRISDKSAPSIADRKSIGLDIRVSFSERERELTAEALRRELGAQALPRQSNSDIKMIQRLIRCHFER